MKKEEVTNTEILAVLNKSFSRIEERFEAIENKVEKLTVETDQNFQRVRKDILIMADKFPSIYQFDELSDRVAKLEAKAGKTKKIKA
jgi:tetrahydromethanopterin S-methyltransferase subunit G